MIESIQRIDIVSNMNVILGALDALNSNDGLCIINLDKSDALRNIA